MKHSDVVFVLSRLLENASDSYRRITLGILTPVLLPPVFCI